MSAIVNYFEIGTPNPAEARRFYTTLFEWSFGEPSPQNYQMINSDQGGLWDTTSLGEATWAIFYVQVDDVQATVARAESLGASVAVPYVDGGDIEFAHLIDPQGHRFGVWRPKSPA